MTNSDTDVLLRELLAGKVQVSVDVECSDEPASISTARARVYRRPSRTMTGSVELDPEHVSRFLAAGALWVGPPHLDPRRERSNAKATVPVKERSKVRVLVYAPDARVRAWVELELDGWEPDVDFAITAREVVRVLVEDPPPRPQVLVVDFDSLSPSDVLGLRELRLRRWFGTIIALGSVSDDAARNIGAGIVIARPFEDDLLRDAVEGAVLGRRTLPLLVIRK